MSKARLQDALYPIIYARVGGPPDDWVGLEIIDLDADSPVSNVIEVDTRAGFVLRYVGDKDLQVCHGSPRCALCGESEPGSHAKAERIEGRYRIMRR